MRYRSAHTIGREHLGKRATIRRATPEGPSDVIGVVEEVDDAGVAIRTRDGTLHTIARADIVAARVHDRPPPAPR